MKFICDAMLGRLAKRLRLMGYDVLFDPTWDDNDIIRRSLEGSRTILTRDNALASRPLAGRLQFITSDRVLQQVNEVVQATAETATALTRCSRCNTLLQPLSEDEARDRVPPHVAMTVRSYRACPACGRVYWKGSHVRGIGPGTTSGNTEA